MAVHQSDSYGKFTKGDHVRIKGVPGFWVFSGYSKTDHGNEWLVVYGGNKNPKGRRQYRYLETKWADHIRFDRAVQTRLGKRAR